MDREVLNRESLHTLQILDEVATGKPLTQRDLSDKLGIALGMTNNYLKRLAREGHIQIIQAERKRLHYLLTPKGIAEKSALTYRYIKRSYQFFTVARGKLETFFLDLEKAGVRSIVLYKATVIAEIAALVLQDCPIQLLAIVDDARAGKKFLGYVLEPVKTLSDLNYDRVLVTTEETAEEVFKDLSRNGVHKEKICYLQ
ncbi:MAG TPA: winged helix-turn-helix transcriptional regulator [Nitrospiria bacterium]|jgi:DNA-binding MarR family transcriptional regulator|nr:winged helix-turn-helix transcriptional regulator [Nitrospiria bacterium]